MVAPEKLRLAYVISAYKLPRHLVRLVDLLDEPTTSFVISVDRHTDDATFDQMLEGLTGRRNVHILPRHSSPYRSFGHVRSSLRGLAHLVDAGIPFDYVSLMTGQDMPIKSNAAIREHLAANDGMGFMEYFSLPTERWSGGGLNRLNRLFFHTHWRQFEIGRRRFGGLISRTMPFDLAPYGGWSYWTLHRDHVDYIRSYLAGNPKYVRFFSHTDISDETFFHTILCNSPLFDRIVNDDLRLIDWSDPEESPVIFRSRDFDRLKCSTDLFARKFDPTVDSEIIERIIDDLL